MGNRHRTQRNVRAANAFHKAQVSSAADHVDKYLAACADYARALIERDHLPCEGTEDMKLHDRLVDHPFPVSSAIIREKPMMSFHLPDNRLAAVLVLPYADPARANTFRDVALLINPVTGQPFQAPGVKQEIPGDVYSCLQAAEIQANAAASSLRWTRAKGISAQDGKGSLYNAWAERDDTCIKIRYAMDMLALPEATKQPEILPI